MMDLSSVKYKLTARVLPKEQGRADRSAYVITHKSCCMFYSNNSWNFRTLCARRVCVWLKKHKWNEMFLPHSSSTLLSESIKHKEASVGVCGVENIRLCCAFPGDYAAAGECSSP